MRVGLVDFRVMDLEFGPSFGVFVFGAGWYEAMGF